MKIRIREVDIGWFRAERKVLWFWVRVGIDRTSEPRAMAEFNRFRPVWEGQIETGRAEVER